MKKGIDYLRAAWKAPAFLSRSICRMSLMSPCVRALFDGVHSDMDVVATGRLMGKPSLEVWIGYGFGFGDGLNGVACRTIPHEGRNVARVVIRLSNIL